MDMPTTHAMLWRRLDSPGHDACQLTEVREGWQVDGTAVFMHEGKPAHLRYQVTADATWRAEDGDVVGWVGDASVNLSIVRQRDGEWTINGSPVPDVRGCIDLDLAFTPATNLFALRRIALDVGEGADAPAAWLDIGTWTLVPLPQRYERRTASTYWYEAPTVGYGELIEVTDVGFVAEYTNLWTVEQLGAR